MGRYRSGDFVKIEVRDDASGESEWMWLLVDHADDNRKLVFGKLENEPIVNTDMRLGMELAVSYDAIRGYRSPESFEKGAGSGRAN